jgi:hypothetical protein
MRSRGVEMAVAAADAGIPVTGLLRDAHRDVLLAVRGLVAGQVPNEPRIGIFEDNGITTVYVSTASGLDQQTRAELRDAVRAALSPYTGLATFTNVVFLTRSML